MTSITKRSAPVDVIQSLQSSGLSPLMSRLLAARGVSNAAQTSIHLNALLPPQQLTNNQAMAKLLAEAIKANKKLLVVGDFLRS
jgi:single-stranded-DNA-specific exonuclease